MTVSRKKERLSLFWGDIIFLYVSLFLMLFVSYLGPPERELLQEHIVAFSVLFIVWLLVFFIAGLYEKHTVIFKSKVPSIVLNSQIVNALIAILFFYLIPYFSIAPKTNLFIYLIISSTLILSWRLYIFPFLGRREKDRAIIVGYGKEFDEILEEINNYRYNISFVSSIDSKNLESGALKKKIFDEVKKKKISLVVLDLQNKKIKDILPELYSLLYSEVQFIDQYEMYEDIFDRVPLSLFRDDWFLSKNSFSPQFAYDIFKRFMDIAISLPLVILSLIFYPFVFVALKIQDGGEVFGYQERVGQNNKIVRLVKFRTMLFNDGGKWKTEGKKNRVTKVGAFLRMTRIDEFPQLWNVLRGDISLIGPRPEFPEPVEHYIEEIPYYNLRYLIKPGLSGWAQIYHDNHPHHGTDVEETGVKLSYDLYYIENRSILLDLKIALRTIMTLLSRSGV